jgi:hypothetical protein
MVELFTRWLSEEMLACQNSLAEIYRTIDRAPE